jgi:hypothetical protein
MHGGAPQFIGENSIGHTPMGSSLALRTGDAFDVKVKATVGAAPEARRFEMAHDDAL